MSETRKRAKLVPMRVDIIEKLRRASESLGIPFRDLVNKVADHGSNLLLLSNGEIEKLEKEYKAMRELSRLGFTLIPVGLLNSLLEECSGESVFGEAVKIGRNIAAVYTLANSISESDIKGLLSVLFPDASEIAMKTEGKRIKIAVVVQGRARRTIELSVRIIDGFLRELGYTKEKEELAPGLAILHYVKEE
uniref:Uncharacterized protein n=1 Tax=Fervidicoccus fontis TaxID=683846 RepID=A0A7J3ZKT6_9CREN